jgi:hypothetical protein
MEFNSFAIPSVLLSTRSTPIADATDLPIVSLNRVNRMIRVLGRARFKMDAACGPPKIGMRTSRRIRSGFNCCAKSTDSTVSMCRMRLSFFPVVPSTQTYGNQPSKLTAQNDEDFKRLGNPCLRVSIRRNCSANRESARLFEP